VARALVSVAIFFSFSGDVGGRRGRGDSVGGCLFGRCNGVCFRLFSSEKPGQVFTGLLRHTPPRSGQCLCSLGLVIHILL